MLDEEPIMVVRSALAVLLLASCTSADLRPSRPELAVAGTPLSALPGSAERGGAFARAQCVSCHAVGRDGASPSAAAPPLREISRRYPVEQLEEAFAEGFVSKHSAMPEFVLNAAQNRDLIAYLASIQSE
jgi:cytochrome c